MSEELGKFNAKEAIEKINDRKDLILKLLLPNVDPYLGRDSTPKECQLSQLPRSIEYENKNEISLQLSFYSSENFVLGLCSDSKTKLKTDYLLLYCKNSNRLFIFKNFYNNSFWNSQSIASCF
jgi:hypothetical protein